MKRIQQVQKKILDWQIDALLIQSKVDLFYLTGLHLSAGTLLIAKDEPILHVDGRYIEIAKRASDFSVVLETVDSFQKMIEPYARIGFDGVTLAWEKAQSFMHDYPQHRWQSIPEPLKTMRAVKDNAEIELMKQAAKLGSEGFDFIKSLLKPGVEERELANRLEIFWKEKGGQGLAFEPIIAFGENSAYPHYRAGKRTLNQGDTVLIDIGVVWENYHSDMTRTLFLGPPKPQIEEIYLIVQEAQKRALRSVRPGVLSGELDHIAREWIEEKGYKDAFNHSLGHGVGLEIHEWPYLRHKAPYDKVELQENMCITLEPGIYIPGLGGVRLEDTVQITSKGGETLTCRSTSLSEAIIHA